MTDKMMRDDVGDTNANLQAIQDALKERIMTDNMTICVECKHYVEEAPMPVGDCGMAVITHDLCKKHENLVRSPVHGHMMLDRTLPYCRDVNKGDCKDFEELDVETANEMLDELTAALVGPYLTRRERFKRWLGMKI